MSDRVSELMRQRALMLEHLAWLDREIASANALVPPAIPPLPALPGLATVSVPPTPVAGNAPALPVAPSTTGTAGIPPVDTAAAPSDVADEVLEQYRVSPKTVHQDVRKGCLLYFAGAFVLLGIVVAILYFTISSR